MNLGAHITIAAALFDDPAVHLGSALPDVATIGGFRIVAGSGTGSVGTGIAFHHATDSVFHSHPWFTSRQKQVFDALTAAGVSRGAARASAHVGVELLLDGELFGGEEGERRDASVGAAFAQATTVDGLESLVAYDARQQWKRHLDQLHRWSSPTYFRQPMGVARRMETILLARPRLAMGSDDVATVAAALEDVQPSIVDSAEAFCDEMIDLLRSWRAPADVEVGE